MWGEGTTSSASDAKKLGVIIHWHVEKKSTCIYFLLKRSSSSEVTFMIEGVLHHGTEMDFDRQYVDSHGFLYKSDTETAVFNSV
ncbi:MULTISPECIES: Tn3 family transposase [unclassified Vibrio]|jgi:TnpA family transposase